MKVKYIIYNPSGNITALVIGDEYSLNERKMINDRIMKINTQVEQVGFLSIKEKRLTMAGNEFCGNGIRCAIMYYGIKEKEVIRISNYAINGGICENNVWCQIPFNKYKLIRISEKINIVEFEGIVFVVINEGLSKDYLNKDLKQEAKKLISLYDLCDNEAVGVIFQERKEYLKIYPIVWVKSINTLFLENACGSGSIALSILNFILSRKSNKYKILQPSGEFLETFIDMKNDIIKKVILSGNIHTDNIVNEIIIKE